MEIQLPKTDIEKILLESLKELTKDYIEIEK